MWANPLMVSYPLYLFDRLSLTSWLKEKKPHVVLISLLLPFLISFFLFFALWKTVTVHSLARVTTPRTTKPLTPQCSHCQILSVFSWKLDGPRCYEVGLQTDRHTTATETRPSVFRLVLKNVNFVCLLPPSLTFHHIRANLNFANINW